jgi:DNA-binding SARP family transcriptional activator
MDTTKSGRSARLSLTLMGGFELRLTSSAVLVNLPTKKAEALVSYLAVVGRGVGRDTLCALLWGDVPAAQSRHSLRQALTQIRGALRPHNIQLVLTTRDRVLLNARAVRVDVSRIDRFLRHGSLRTLRAACELARGDFLDGIDVRETEFERWLTLERARVRQQSIEAHERYAAMLIERGDHPRAIKTALRLIGLDPLHERGHCMLMTLYAATGQPGAALRQYADCAAILARELHVQPSPETEAVRRDISHRFRRRAEPSSEAADAPRRPQTPSSASRDEPPAR